jgi:uncharacterized membrane protein YgcG
MAEKSRTLKLSILGDVDNLTKGLSKASKDTQTFSGNITNIAKKATIAFGAAAAAIGVFATAAIKNALADEAAQRKLAETLRVSTGATIEQTRAVEGWISKTSVAIGVTDDELRPSLARLARSTNDVQKAQDLLNLALDISAATGKPLEAVSNALGKAYDGNAASLGRLGLGLDANILKSKDTDAIMNTLKRTFGTFAENEAETTAKKFERIQIATDEAKEAIGAALLPIVEKLATFILTTFVPNMNAFIAGLTGAKNESGEATQGAFAFGEMVKKVAKIVYDFKELLIITAGVVATVFVVSKISAAVTATIALIKSLIMAYNALKASAIVTGIATAFALNPLLGVGAVALAASVLAAGNALANSSTSNIDLGDGTTGGLNPIQSGTYLNPSRGAGGGGGLGGGGGAGGGGGGGSLFTPQAATSLKDLVDKLTNLNEAIGETVFQVETGGISKAAGAAKLAEYQAQIAVLERQAQSVGAIETTSNFNPGGFRLAEARTLNINMGIVGDPEAAARVIVDTLTDSAARGGVGTFVTSSWDR